MARLSPPYCAGPRVTTDPSPKMAEKAKPLEPTRTLPTCRVREAPVSSLAFFTVCSSSRSLAKESKSRPFPTAKAVCACRFSVATGSSNRTSTETVLPLSRPTSTEMDMMLVGQCCTHTGAGPWTNKDFAPDCILSRLIMGGEAPWYRGPGDTQWI